MDTDHLLSQDAGSPENNAFDVLERTLAHMHRREDPQPMMELIRSRFPSAESMYRANRYLWLRMGLRKNDALLFSLMKDICRYTQVSSYGEHPHIATLREASPYLAANFFGMGVEYFYMYTLNRAGNLKERIRLNAGIADTALFDLRTLLMETVRQQPLGGVIIAHNHPGGTMRPSQDDIQCTLEAIHALSALNVPLLDHVIIARGKVVSLRLNGFVPEDVWVRSHPKHRILHSWLSAEDLPPPAASKKQSKPSK